MTGRASVKAAALLAAVVLAGCGGGGSDDPGVTAKAEGAYTGEINGAVLQVVVLENDEFWAFDGSLFNNAFLVEGFLQGQGVSSGGSFRSTSARDFGFAPPRDATVTSTYVPAVSIDGSVSHSGSTFDFSADAFAAATYDYKAAASLAALQGSWNMRDLASTTVGLTVQASGAFTATGGNCTFSGNFTPRASGKNVFNVTITFGASPCTLEGQTLRGIAITQALTGGGRHLMLAGITTQRDAGTALSGTKQ